MPEERSLFRHFDPVALLRYFWYRFDGNTFVVADRESSHEICTVSTYDHSAYPHQTMSHTDTENRAEAICSSLNDTHYNYTPSYDTYT